MKMKNLIVYIGFLVTVFSCNNHSEKSTTLNKLTKVTLRQEWFTNASYLGEVVALNETDSINGIDIKLIAGADDVDPVKMVLSGNSDFGVAGSDRIFSAREKGADLVIIGVINYINPTCFIAKAEKNILTPKDFEGKRVGVYSGNNTEMVYRTLVRKEKLNQSKIKEVEPSFDLASFIADAYDVRPAYIFDETVSLDMKGIKYTIVKPEDYGIKFIGNVYFTTRQMIQKKPEVVQAFINSIASGWKKAIADPKKAVDYLKAFDNAIDKNREYMSFEKGVNYFKGERNNILQVDNNRWQQMGDYLKDLGIIKSYEISKTIDTSFIHKYKNNG